MKCSGKKKKQLRGRGFISVFSSRLHSNTVGKLKQELQTASHITFTAKSRADGNVYMLDFSLLTLSCLLHSCSSRPLPKEWCYHSELDFPTSINLIKTITYKCPEVNPMLSPLCISQKQKLLSFFER